MRFINNTFSQLFSSRKYYTPYYKRTLQSYTDIITYHELFCRVQNCDRLEKTKRKIYFSDNLFFGTTFKNVKDRFYGSFRVVNQLKGITILFSEMKISKFKFVLEMHFFNDQLVFFKYVFRKKEDKELLLEMIREKYLSDKKKDLSNYYSIKDDYGNFIFLENEVDLSVYYLSFNFGFFEHILETKEKKEFLIIKDKEESLEKLYNTI